MSSSHDQLRLAAARQLLGHIHSWELPPIADQLLSSGFYSDSIFEISIAKDAPMSELAPLLGKALQETSVPWHTRLEAAWIVARYYITQIAESRESPFSALKHIHQMNWDDHFGLHTANFADELDLWDLIETYYSSVNAPEHYCDATHRTYSNEQEQREALTAHARKVSRQWLARHPE